MSLTGNVSKLAVF